MSVLKHQWSEWRVARGAGFLSPLQTLSANCALKDELDEPADESYWKTGGVI